MTFAEIWETISDAGITTGKNIQKTAKDLSKYDKEDILAAIGLEPKRSTTGVILPALGFFAVGVLAGVGVGLLFAPKPGYELREDLSEAAKTAMKKAEEMNAEMPSATEPVV
jgi:hypothetical protein